MAENLKLDDARRVKVLSPGMMVFKRFIRNRLAIFGLCILIFMFAFSFLGGLISPYKQDQVFYKYDYANKQYASAKFNTDYGFVAKDGAPALSAQAKAQFVLAEKNGAPTFQAGGTTYSLEKVSDGFYRIGKAAKTRVASVMMIGKIDGKVTPEAGVSLSDEVAAEAIAAAKKNLAEFTAGDTHYTLEKEDGKKFALFESEAEEIALATLLSFDAASKEYASLVSEYGFRSTSEEALHAGAESFDYDGATYTLQAEDDDNATVYQGDALICGISNISVNPYLSSVALSLEYKTAVRNAIVAKETAFDFTDDKGETISSTISRNVSNYDIYTKQVTHLIDMCAYPSAEHWLGTDDHGMDMMTRLMYGGRISLMVGFVVVFLEIVIGIVMGGISGYFGGMVDTLIMRFVDLFNSIPYYPMMIIAGSIMDAFEINPYTRIFLLMVIMGIMGWTGVARVVRGQILSLREQDFMVAAEATGIRVSRRIFRHLVPNVMPLLIVQATMGLGSIILTEATLSFLGLGIKYPLASWGSIINSASNLYIMTYYWFIWIPAGILIVLTVLGFNFVGDGLRDAFDPKMKR
ncbi:MAG: ABC transporter permease [Christensenellales bacterium]|jgi:peptide/nickel transport system permease protein